MKVQKLRLALILIPYTFIAILPIINVIRIDIIGVPLLWFWAFIWVVLTAIIISILYLVESREEKKIV